MIHFNLNGYEKKSKHTRRIRVGQNFPMDLMVITIKLKPLTIDLTDHIKHYIREGYLRQLQLSQKIL